MESYIVYITYLLISLLLTIRVGNSLHYNGRPWIISLFHDVALSDKLNNTLLLLYRLVNIGYILLTLMGGGPVGKTEYQIIEFLSARLGIIISILAFLHFQNIVLLIMYSKLKSKNKWEI